MDYCSNFKYDLKLGQVAEQDLAKIFSEKTIEVKKDYLAQDTGNVFVEYESRNKPSGLATTQADYYCFVIEDSFILIETTKLKDLVRPLYRTSQDVPGGDDYSSRGILLPLEILVKGL